MDNMLHSIFTDVFCLKPGATIEDWTMDTVAEWDSLRHMDLIGSIEQQHDIELTFDEIVEMRSFDAIRKILTDKGKIQP